MAKKEIENSKKVKKDEPKEVKETKKNSKPKKSNNKPKKKPEKVKKETYFEGLKSEVSKVKWPSKKEVMKYTFATVVLVLFLVGFFLLMWLLMTFITGVFK